jgi:two-component system C4-dicarboxylate transport response regulator DctD
MLTDTNSTNNKSRTTDMSSTQRKILIVDDDFDLTSMFKMVLEMNGFEVDAYNDPLLALHEFKANCYGMALFDIRMPELNGFELYKKIQEKDNKIKVCFITAFEDYNDEFKQSFPELDETKCFVRKPKAVEDLVKHVATILG